MPTLKLVIVLASAVVFVFNGWQLIAVRRSVAGTSADMRHILGLQFLLLMVIAGILLDAPFGSTVRNLVASVLGVVGILLLLSTRD